MVSVARKLLKNRHGVRVKPLELDTQTVSAGSDPAETELSRGSDAVHHCGAEFAVHSGYDIKRLVYRPKSLVLFSVLLCPAAWAVDPPKCPEGPSRIDVASGTYSPIPGVAFALRNFTGAMVPSGKQIPACLVRVTQIEQGRVAVSSASLDRLIQARIRPKDSSLSDLKVEMKEGRAVLTGKMKKFLSFRVEGPVTGNGENLRIQAKTVKAAGIPIKGLLEMIGVELSGLMGDNSVKGVTVQEDTIIFRLEAFGNIRGHVQSAKIASSTLVVDFAKPPGRRASAQGQQKPSAVAER